MDTALSMLRRDGIVVIRDALDRGEMERVSAAAQGFMRDIRDRIERGSYFSDMDKKYNFNAPTFACDLVAIAPETAAEPNNLQLEKTALYRAVMKGPLLPLLKPILTEQASWQMARMRVVFADRARKKSGAIDFHQEQIVTKFPGVHNIWTTLTPAGTVANRDTPGVQFYIGRRQELCSLQMGTPQYEALIDRMNITPAYSLLDEATVARAHSIMPHAEIIFIMRDPIDRIWSHFCFSRSRIAKG